MVTAAKVERVKRDLIRQLESDKGLAVVGRVRDWLYDPESRYPISCTVLSVKDSMEGVDGIEESWLYASRGLRGAAGVALNLSNLRAKNTDNGRGLVASGPVSFMSIYSELNATLRRGGKFKNGAIVTYLNVGHPDALEYITSPVESTPWLKKALYVSDNPTDPDYLFSAENASKVPAILSALNSGFIWLAKKRWENDQTGTQNYPPYPEDPEKGRLYSQVCLEILLPSRGTCTLSHVNLGALTLKEIPYAFERGMRFLCDLHEITGADRADNYYLSPKIDKQVGLGVLGLANLLAREGVTYKQFTDCLYDAVTNNVNPKTGKLDGHSLKAVQIVRAIQKGFRKANKVASYKKYNMRRAFTIAPTASCSYRHMDSEGYTTTPEISPPICHPETKISSRDSGTFGVVDYQYPPTVETAESVGWDTYYKLVNTWQLLMESTGKAHSISFNLWDQASLDKDWLQDWLLNSPSVTTYYRMQTLQLYTDKSNINATSSGDVVEDDFFEAPKELEDELDFDFSGTSVLWANNSDNVIECDCAE